MDDFPRLTRLPPYIFAKLDELKTQFIAAGNEIIDFGMGNPDLPTPQHVLDALVAGVMQPSSGRYTVSRGIRPLREAISHWYAKRFQVLIDPDKETIATIGSKEGLAHLALATTAPGDNVLVPTPAYPVHTYGFIIAGANVCHVPLVEDPKQFYLAIEQQIKNLTPRPRCLVLNFPCNPTAQCVDLAFFENIVGLAKKYNFWIVHDFAYAELMLDGTPAPSILQIPGAKDVAVEAYSLSKTYNMPGYRLGFISGNEKLVAALAKIKSYMDYGMFAPVQSAGIAALTGPQECIEHNREFYRTRRDILCASFADHAKWNIEKPRATMFVWAPIPEPFRELGSLAFCQLLLSKAKVAVSPGIAFGEGGDGFVRFSLIQDEIHIVQAAEAIGKIFLQGHTQNSSRAA